MSNQNITILECLLYKAQGMDTVINDGKVVGFVKGETAHDYFAGCFENTEERGQS